jgi:hypothetical protein
MNRYREGLPGGQVTGEVLQGLTDQKSNIKRFLLDINYSRRGSNTVITRDKGRKVLF